MKRQETWSEKIAKNYIRYLLRPSFKIKFQAWFLNLKIQIKKFWVKKIKGEKYFLQFTCVACYMCGGTGYFKDLEKRCPACIGYGYIDYKKWKELRG